MAWAAPGQACVHAAEAGCGRRREAPTGLGDRLLATLAHLRHGATHDVPACWSGVDRSTLTQVIGEVRPLLAERGCSVSAGVRLRPPAEVVDHLGAGGEPAGSGPPPRRPRSPTGTPGRPWKRSVR
ncbi:transposase family protein [Streptomyces caelestis]|uniref:helix-turn-helix domain-containing protein n=1 Tax=Streptomyces caelestis TaxID=36816 RepID=UPI00365EE712